MSRVIFFHQSGRFHGTIRVTVAVGISFHHTWAFPWYNQNDGSRAQFPFLSSEISNNINFESSCMLKLPSISSSGLGSQVNQFATLSLLLFMTQRGVPSSTSDLGVLTTSPVDKLVTGDVRLGILQTVNINE